MKKNVIGIAGAGIAGLTAGIELLKEGHSVALYEARQRTGGRIFSFRENGMLVEAGPEFIHGNLKQTRALLRKYGIRHEAVNGKMYHALDGVFEVQHEMTEGWDDLLSKMESVEDDMVFDDFLKTYFPAEHFKELRKSAVRYAQGFDLADTKYASTKALWLEWNQEGDEQYHIPDGYGSLIAAREQEFIQLGGIIHLDHKIRGIVWQENKVIIRLLEKPDVEVDKCLLCIPVPMLDQNNSGKESVIFHPAIPEKNSAFSGVGYGTVIKIVTVWNHPFWKKIIPEAQFIFSDCFIPTWWTKFPEDIPMLTGWLGGPSAEIHAENNDEYFREKSLQSLSVIFSMSVEELQSHLKKIIIFNWKNEPWSRGAYTYSKIGFSRKKEIMKTPLQQNIYFAGEAFYEGSYPGTVEAALVSALDVSAQMIKDFEH